MAETVAEFSTGWHDRVRNRIRQRLPPGTHYDAEADRRFQELMAFKVPSYADLVEMEKRGELPTDEELERDGH